jgi:hypothetical protein
MKYKQIEVIETLRKHPTSPLWNKVISNWTDEDKKEYLKLKYGIVTTKKKNLSDKKVVRISDGTIYSSISECAKMNNIIYQVVYNNVIGSIVKPNFKYYE